MPGQSMEIRTPKSLNKRLWQRAKGTGTIMPKTCTHRRVDDTPFVLKPMNCPSRHAVDLTAHRSYRICRCGLRAGAEIHRRERSGTSSTV